VETHNQSYSLRPRLNATQAETETAQIAEQVCQLTQIQMGDQDGHLSVEPPPPANDNRVRLFKGIDEFGNFWTGRGELNAPTHLPSGRYALSNYMLTPMAMRMVASCQDNERDARIHRARFDHDITDGLPRAHSFLGEDRADSLSHLVPTSPIEFAQWRTLWAEATTASHAVVDHPTDGNIRQSVFAYFSHLGALDALPGRVVKLSRLLFPVAHCRPVLMVGGDGELPELLQARDLYLKSRQDPC
jgi:hypothetical protein